MSARMINYGFDLRFAHLPLTITVSGTDYYQALARTEDVSDCCAAALKHYSERIARTSIWQFANNEVEDGMTCGECSTILSSLTRSVDLFGPTAARMQELLEGALALLHRDPLTAVLEASSLVGPFQDKLHALRATLFPAGSHVLGMLYYQIKEHQEKHKDVAPLVSLAHCDSLVTRKPVRSDYWTSFPGSRFPLGADLAPNSWETMWEKHSTYFSVRRQMRIASPNWDLLPQLPFSMADLD